MRLCWVLLFLAFNVWGQSAQKWIQKGDEYRQKLAFADAVDAYQKALKREQSLSEGEKVQLKIGLGEAYYQLRRYELAFQSWEPVKEKAPVSLHKNMLRFWRHWADMRKQLKFGVKYREANYKRGSS